MLFRSSGQGGLLVTLRFDVAAGREEEQRRLLAHRVLPELAERPGIAAAHLLIADTAASSVVTAEKKDRPQPAKVPAWIVLAEGGADPESLRAAAADALADAMLAAAGAVNIERGLYQLQYSRTKTPSTVG